MPTGILKHIALASGFSCVSEFLGDVPLVVKGGGGGLKKEGEGGGVPLVVKGGKGEVETHDEGQGEDDMDLQDVIQTNADVSQNVGKENMAPVEVEKGVRYFVSEVLIEVKKGGEGGGRKLRARRG